MTNSDYLRATTILSFPPYGSSIVVDVDVAPFQAYEMLVAKWLGGRVAAVHNAAFDVWKCKPFPDLTFQVKFSSLKTIRKQKSPAHVWKWTQEPLSGMHPDYFIFCGIGPSGEDNWFVLPHRAFVARANKTNRGTWTLQGYVDRFSQRGRRGGRWLNFNFIWDYHCPDPRVMIEHIERQQQNLQLSLL